MPHGPGQTAKPLRAARHWSCAHGAKPCRRSSSPGLAPASAMPRPPSSPATSCDAGLDAPPAAVLAAAAVVASLVGVQLGRPAARSAQRKPLRGFAGLPERTGGMASSVAASMALSCRLAPLRTTPGGVPRAATRWRFSCPACPADDARIAAGPSGSALLQAPFFAGTEALSSVTRLQSTGPTAPSTPARHHKGAGRPTLDHGGMAASVCPGTERHRGHLARPQAPPPCAAQTTLTAPPTRP